MPQFPLFCISSRYTSHLGVHFSFRQIVFAANSRRINFAARAAPTFLPLNSPKGSTVSWQGAGGRFGEQRKVGTKCNVGRLHSLGPGGRATVPGGDPEPTATVAHFSCCIFMLF